MFNVSDESEVEQDKGPDFEVIRYAFYIQLFPKFCDITSILNALCLEGISKNNFYTVEYILYISSVKWGLLARNEVGLFQIFDHVKTIKNH